MTLSLVTGFPGHRKVREQKVERPQPKSVPCVKQKVSPPELVRQRASDCFLYQVNLGIVNFNQIFTIKRSINLCFSPTTHNLASQNSKNLIEIPGYKFVMIMSLTHITINKNYNIKILWNYKLLIKYKNYTNSFSFTLLHQ